MKVQITMPENKIKKEIINLRIKWKKALFTLLIDKEVGMDRELATAMTERVSW